MTKVIYDPSKRGRARWRHPTAKELAQHPWWENPALWHLAPPEEQEEHEREQEAARAEAQFQLEMQQTIERLQAAPPPVSRNPVVNQMAAELEELRSEVARLRKGETND